MSQGDWLWALSLEQPPQKLGEHRSPLDRLKMGVCPGATPGTFVHDPSAEKVLQSLIQAGGHPILLTCARYWHLLGGKSYRVFHLGQGATLPSSQDFPLWPWTGFPQSHGNLDFSPPGHFLSLVLGSILYHNKDCHCLADRSFLGKV